MYLILCLIFYPTYAYAYIDPASIGFVFQAIILVVSTTILYLRNPYQILKDLKSLYKWSKSKLTKKKK